MNPSLHYVGAGSIARADHAECAAQNEAIIAARPEYGDGGAYSHQVCIHGQVFEGRGWDRDAAANGQEPPGVWHNEGSRSLCMHIGGDDDITPALEVAVRGWYREAGARGFDGPLLSHSDIVRTQCCGDNGRALVARINSTPGDDDMTPEQEAKLDRIHSALYGDLFTEGVKAQTTWTKAYLGGVPGVFPPIEERVAGGRGPAVDVDEKAVADAIVAQLGPDLAKRVADELAHRLDT